MFPVRNYDDQEGDDLRLDESRRRRSGWWAAEGEHDFGSSSEQFFHRQPSRKGESRDAGDDALRRGRAEKAELRRGLFGRGKAARQEHEAHRVCGMVTERVKSQGSHQEHVDIDVCESLPRADRIACQFFVRAFGDDIIDKLDEPVEDICDELDYTKTAPSRSQPQSDAVKRDNLRGAEDARRARGGDPKRDRAPTADLDEGARALTASRARTPGGSSAGLNKGGRAMPVVSTAQQKEVGWDTVDPQEEGHPAASSGRAGMKGLNTRKGE